MTAIKWFLVSVLFFAVFGCKEEVDDQTIAKGAAWQAANPLPSARKFLENNQRHQVLVAVVDSGADYNHPQLLNNMHFTLDEHNRPVGLGYDFIGQDYWPSPYVARTLDINPDADQKDVPAAKMARERSTHIIKAYPQLSEYLNPLRNVEQESESGAFHGTHVSGLMVHDDPRIGLIPYRVLPINIKYKNGRRDQSQDATSIVFANIIQSLKMAVNAGARVVNMSLALKAGSTASLLNGLEDSTKKYKTWMAQVQEFMDKNPHVVFVAAAGNDSEWVDDKTNLQLPCGISARNLVCVGALTKEGNLAAFSNIVLSPSVFVAAYGVDVESTRPVYSCESSFLSKLDYDKNVYPFDKPENQNYAVAEFMKECLGKTPMRKASGTSMASPAVARVVAGLIIENPNKNAQQIIQLLVERSEKIQLGPLLLNRIKTAQPSWATKTVTVTKP